MSEKKVVIEEQEIYFDGLFDMKGLFRTITKWFKDHGYDMLELKNIEDVREDSKKIVFQMAPYKKLTDYHKIEIFIFSVYENLKEVEVEINGVKHKLLKGGAFLSFDANFITDYESRWEGRASYFFFRTIIDKFIYKSFTSKYEKQLAADTANLIQEIKSYLNMFRYTV